jgi:hypothetical protein
MLEGTSLDSCSTLGEASAVSWSGAAMTGWMVTGVRDWGVEVEATMGMLTRNRSD